MINDGFDDDRTIVLCIYLVVIFVVRRLLSRITNTIDEHHPITLLVAQQIQSRSNFICGIKRVEPLLASTANRYKIDPGLIDGLVEQRSQLWSFSLCPVRVSSLSSVFQTRTKRRWRQAGARRSDVEDNTLRCAGGSLTAGPRGAAVERCGG